MINKYITGYNSGEWRLTLTEHRDLHTTAKPQSFNKSQLLFAFFFFFIHPLLNDNFLKCKHGMEKVKKNKNKKIKDRTPNPSSSATQRHFGFDRTIFYFLGLTETGGKQPILHQQQQDGEVVPWGILKSLSETPHPRMCLPPGCFLALAWFSVHLISPTHKIKHVWQMLGLHIHGYNNKWERERLATPLANPSPYLWEPYPLLWSYLLDSPFQHLIPIFLQS